MMSKTNKQDILSNCCYPLAETIKLTVANFWAPN